ncbi:MAG: hypothetical protein M3R01_07440, partial [Actinomycetota bacterium]|nr:hypothetical protein [Actinomycetota bacterium]
MDPCRRGIHACRSGDLPYWISDQLFEIELDGGVVELDRKVAARRGRLVRQLDLWSNGVACELMERAGFRARDLAVSALGRAGRHEEATALAAVGTLPSLGTFGATMAAELGPETPLGVSVGLASDGAHYALVGEPAQA